MSENPLQKTKLWEDIKKEILKKISKWVELPPLSPNADIEEQKIYEQKFVNRLCQKIMWHAIILLPLFILIFWLGSLLGPNTTPDSKSSSTNKKQGRKIKFWTCSMHPQIKLPTNDAKCPICFMDLVPAFEGDGGEIAANVLVLTENASKLAEIRTQPVLYRRLKHTLRMVGKVAYDETKVANISLWTPGRSRLNRMFVSFTGAKVTKGEPLVEVYSPDLIAAQGEYLSAYNSKKAMKKVKKSRMLAAITDNLEASKRKLLDLGMALKQIRLLEKRNKPEEKTLLYSPVTGTITGKLVNEGEWHGRGMSIYRIADLSQVWVKLEAYESDMNWIRYAQKIKFTTEAYPGVPFTGRIAFIDPFLNEITRTVHLRVNVKNDDGRLKPGMFVKGIIEARVAEGGQVIDDDLASKWICPTHPERIKQKPQICNAEIGIGTNMRCKNSLVSGQQLNFIDQNHLRSRVLSIPHTAPLFTGERAVVYVEEKKEIYDDEGNVKSTKLHYRTTFVNLGPRAGNYYIVLSGLEEGQQVVTHGAFKIDSALQILAKPSMMNPQQMPQQKEEKIPPYAIANLPYHKELEPVLATYLNITSSLAKDDLETSYRHLLHIKKIMANLSSTMIDLPEISKQKLEKHLDSFRNFSTQENKKDIDSLRQALKPLTTLVTSYLEDFGHQNKKPIYKKYCDMAKAFWWQSPKKLANPYYGLSMLDCGDDKETLFPLKDKQMGKIAAISGRYWSKNALYHKPFKKLIDAYLVMGEIMAKDKTKGILVNKKIMLKALSQIDTKKMLKNPKAQNTMKKQLAFLRQIILEMRGDDLQQLRRDYLDISAVIVRYLKNFGHLYPGSLYIIHCPMYRHDLGGSWLQNSPEAINPYFGSKMERCGNLEGIIPSMAHLEKSRGRGE